jgi:hypothetical protein
VHLLISRHFSLGNAFKFLFFANRNGATHHPLRLRIPVAYGQPGGTTLCHQITMIRRVQFFWDLELLDGSPAVGPTEGDTSDTVVAAGFSSDTNDRSGADRMRAGGSRSGAERGVKKGKMTLEQQVQLIEQHIAVMNSRNGENCKVS